MDKQVIDTAAGRIARPPMASSTRSSATRTRSSHECGVRTSRSRSGRPAARSASMAPTNASAPSATVSRSPSSARLATGVATMGTPAEA